MSTQEGGRREVPDACSPGGIVAIAPSMVPRTTAHVMAVESRKYTTAPKLEIDEFDGLYSYTFPDGQTTYFAHHDKRYDVTSEQTERLIYAVDVLPPGSVVGVGEVRFALTDTSPFFLGKPFVGHTHTEESHRLRGFGRRRLLAMNAASLLINELSLHSDTLRSLPATRVWQKLVRQGLAEIYFEPADAPERPANSRFKFKI